MSQLYLLDRHVATLSNAPILDVQEFTSPNPGPSVSGRLVVKVPDGINLQSPLNLSDLITKKAAGLLLFYAGLTRISYDDLMDTSAIDFTNSFGLVAGTANTITLQPGGMLQTDQITWISSVPTESVVTWDTYNYTNTDSSNALYARTYNDVPSVPSNVICTMSTDHGSTWIPMLDSELTPFVPGSTTFILRFQNASTGRLSIGSWSMIY